MSLMQGDVSSLLFISTLYYAYKPRCTGVLITPWPDQEGTSYSDHTLTFASHSKKKFRNLSVQPGLCSSNDLHVRRKMATFQLFFSVGSG